MNIDEYLVQSDTHGRPGKSDQDGCYIIKVDDHDVGLIQWHFGDYPEYAREVQMSGSAWVDVLIGNRDSRNRGVGSESTRKFVEDVLFADPRIQRCAIDPDPENHRAIRANEKAGFRHVRTYRKNTDGIDSYLMTWERPVAQRP